MKKIDISPRMDIQKGKGADWETIQFARVINGKVFVFSRTIYEGCDIEVSSDRATAVPSDGDYTPYEHCFRNWDYK